MLAVETPPRTPRISPRSQGSRGDLPTAGERNRWLSLFVVTRGCALVVALLLLAVHRITAHDALLAAMIFVYAAGSVVLATRRPSLQRSAPAWTVDCAVVLGFVLAGQDWRSAFYLLALSALVLPATTLPLRAALAFGVLFDVAYLAVAVLVGLDWHTVDTTARLESFATHLMVPLLVVLSLAYAAGLLERLGAERLRSERLALDAERRRIAWELHDSAKQRIHAAHLLLTAVDDEAPAIRQARGELEAAVADMDDSLSDLRTPLPHGGGIVRALRERAQALARAGDVTIAVDGDEPPIPSAVAAHVFRIAVEAMTNAVRHASAAHIAVRLSVEDSSLVVHVRDDGRGLDPAAPEGSGLRSMRGRAIAVGADLRIAGGAGGRGTEVRLAIPLRRPAQAEA